MEKKFFFGGSLMLVLVIQEIVTSNKKYVYLSIMITELLVRHQNSFSRKICIRYSFYSSSPMS